MDRKIEALEKYVLPQADDLTLAKFIISSKDKEISKFLLSKVTRTLALEKIACESPELEISLLAVDKISNSKVLTNIMSSDKANFFVKKRATDIFLYLFSNDDDTLKDICNFVSLLELISNDKLDIKIRKKATNTFKKLYLDSNLYISYRHTNLAKFVISCEDREISAYLVEKIFNTAQLEKIVFECKCEEIGLLSLDKISDFHSLIRIISNSNISKTIKTKAIDKILYESATKRAVESVINLPDSDFNFFEITKNTSNFYFLLHLAMLKENITKELFDLILLRTEKIEDISIVKFMLFNLNKKNMKDITKSLILKTNKMDILLTIAAECKDEVLRKLAFFKLDENNLNKFLKVSDDFNLIMLALEKLKLC